MQVEFPGVRRVVGALALLFLCACSGGNDSESSRQINLSTTSLAFNANAPDASAPEPQVITATFSEGIANLTALHTGPAIERVDIAISGSSAQLTVVPSAPTTLGAGAFKGTIAVTAYFCGDTTCSRLEAGATQTVTAAYQISPVVNDVAPKVAIAGTSATAVIRGLGFQGFTIQGVSFGTTPATSITVSSGTEIRATYPALAAGDYPVTIDVPSHSGAITSTATLIVVDPVVQAAQTLAWPGTVGTVYALEYDALRGALLVATDTDGGQLVRYTYASGAWQPAAAVAIPDLRDAALSTDATQIIAITTTAVVPVDPATLALGTAVDAPSLPENSHLKTLAMLNTNQALITTGIAASTDTPMYSYTIRTGALEQLSVSVNNGTARSSANGATMAIMQGDPSLTSAPPLVVASASTGGISQTGILLNQNAIPPVLDRDATRFVLNGTRVHDTTAALAGTFPDTTAAVAVRPDGARAYTYDTAANALLVFDISATNNGEAFTPLGDPVPLAADPGAAVKMAISPDANTLYIAGTTQLVVQPTPAL